MKPLNNTPHAQFVCTCRVLSFCNEILPNPEGGGTDTHTNQSKVDIGIVILRTARQSPLTGGDDDLRSAFSTVDLEEVEISIPRAVRPWPVCAAACSIIKAHTTIEIFASLFRRRRRHHRRSVALYFALPEKPSSRSLVRCGAVVVWSVGRWSNAPD